MRKSIFLIITGIILMQPFILSAQEYSDNEFEFFTFEKYRHTYLYFYNYQYLDLSGAGSAARRIQGLAKNFVSGFDAIKKGRIDEAILRFQESSGIVPEYFHIDFIIALTYEKKGDIETAARFYKSYLGKLKKFQGGMYRFTQPLIIKTVDFDISGYEEAKELIDQRMTGYGIDMQRVPSSRYSASFIIIIFLVGAGAVLYSLARTNPVKRMIYKTKAKFNRNKESWICLYCGRENANINRICYGCKR